MAANWRGVFPALMTEMFEDGSLDLEATARHVEALLEAGVNGIIALGTLGENCSLTREEKSEVARRVVTAAGGRVPVLSGVAEYTTEMAIERARAAEWDGCDGLMVLPGMVYKSDARETIAHFRAVASATGLPMMIYNNPVTYGVDLAPGSFRAFEDLSNIIAIKESSDDVRRVTDIINVCGERYTLFCGVDDLILESTMAGVRGWVAGLVNAFPRESVHLFRLAATGRYEQALRLYRWFMPLLHLDTHPKLVQYIKLANAMTGQGSEWVRAPRLPLEGDERARVSAIIRQAMDTRPSLERLAAE